MNASLADGGSATDERTNRLSRRVSEGLRRHEQKTAWLKDQTLFEGIDGHNQHEAHDNWVEKHN